ncbi:aminoacyl-tRNA hydrolase [Desulfurispira natronophila]|uniref:Peptidyl-tRNA hydrolase n=1 Tax=Desulfurispira natronophila TaxID=682562 RepID=A0A7W7Y2P7_9BACT|nr:aminoacyl-tRNA hydrolase [Desulfurispira natronophila]MBB5020929.1 PTH1 family peptidyl-tRNA hydrolase [Desulfurispira natronophila]
MKLLVGLGNPGPRYCNHRHNIGFMVIERLIQQWQAPAPRKKFNGLMTEVHRENQKVLLLMPQTFMNLSGDSVQQATQWFDLQMEDILVIQDDLDMPFGRFKLRVGGSPGGHNGIADITRKCSSDKYVRAKCGIGRPAPGQTVYQHVLSSFSTEELPELPDIITHVAKAADCWVQEGLAVAMNKFNGNVASI